MESSQTAETLKKIKNKKLKIGLAVEGGGLRGLVSASMLKGLNDLGLANQVHCLAGTSSGAINGSYFLSGQMNDLFSLYKKMASSQFIQPFQFPDAMNLDYLFCNQIPKFHPIEVQNIKSNYYVTVTSVKNGKSRALQCNHLNTQEDLLTHLRASCSAPLYTTNQETIGGEILNDGHVGMAIPYQPLLNENVDYIVCLMTQPMGYQKKQKTFAKIHQFLSLRKYSKAYQKAFSQSYDLYNKQLGEIFAHPKLVPLQISQNDFVISKMCTDPKQVDRCKQSVIQRITNYFTSTTEV